MDREQKTEAEQLEFFQKSYERFLMAKRSATGSEDRFYRLGGTTVRLEFAGENMVPRFTPALDHLRVERANSPDLTLCIWDSDSTHTEMVPQPCPRKSFTDRGDIWGFNSRRIKTAFHWIECSVNLMDLQTNTGIYWVQKADALPYWVYASPLRTLLHWWMEKHGCQLLHAAVVGTENGAVLITGKGAVGKSTTALSCLRSGFYYLADDYVVARLDPEPVAYSLYCTAKLNSDHVTTFPEFSPLIRKPLSPDQEKAVMFLYPHLKDRIVGEMPLKSILTPQVGDGHEVTVSPAEKWAIRRAMAFTTMSQLPYVGRHTYDFIGRLSDRLPSYNLHVCRDLQKIPIAISDVLAGSLRYQASAQPSPEPGSGPGPSPLVSVIIPVFNGEDFIKEALKNVQSQNYPALEIIVVDDGSTDNTGQIVKHLPLDIRYFRQGNNGPAAARNRGIRDASGEFIVFLDVDDLWPENNLNRLVSEMMGEPEMEVIRGYAQMMQYRPETGEYDFVTNPKESFQDYIGAAIYRKSVFSRVGLFDPTLIFGEDTDWYNRAKEMNVSTKRLEEITLFVRRHGKNMTEGKNNLELGTLQIFKKRLDRRRNLLHDREDSTL